MGAKFPEGPWTAKGTRIYAADGEEIAVATRASPRYRGRAGKTARLIAAAPEMYEALDLVRGYIRDGNSSMVQVVEEALAKARGET